MVTQEKKLEIWTDLSRQMGCPPKDSEEYFQKTEAYYHILEQLNSQDTQQPPQRVPQRAPDAHVKAQSLRAEPDVREFEMQRPRGVCYCDCHHRTGDDAAPMVPMVRQHKVTRGKSAWSSGSESDGSYRPQALRTRPQENPQEKRPRGRPRRVVISDSESESESESEKEEVKPKLKRKVEVPSAKKKPEPQKATKKSSTKRASR